MMACSRVGGLSGSFIPVSEDAGMIEAVKAGNLNLEKLEAMTAICSVGLDMVAIPGHTASSIAGMIADEAAIRMMNHKTTAVRVIPAVGTSTGDDVDFGRLLGHAPVMPVSSVGSDGFISRGGFIPAPSTDSATDHQHHDLHSRAQLNDSPRPDSALAEGVNSGARRALHASRTPPQ